MKRTLLLIMVFLPMLASADSIEIDGIYYNLNPVDKTAEVTYGNWDPITPIDGDGRYSGEIAIPESVDYKGVSYSITTIGYYAFDYCEDLNAVTIPSSVTSIYICSFRNCSGLTSITIPNSVTSIEKDAFWGCSGLISVNIPGSVTYIGESAFWGCSALTSITIPNSVTFIGSYAFEGCGSLTSFTIPDGVTFISEFVFNGCTSLASITIPDGLTSIGNYAFQNCSSLTSISIPSSVTSIGNYAFAYCSSITSLNIPSSITSIGNSAFRGCSSLTSLSIPSSVTSLGISPFCGCIGLTSIKVEEGNIVYDSRNNCNAIIKTDNNELITGCDNTLIPDDVTSIALGAFSCCSGLTSVTIPNGVTFIGSSAFEGCSGLTSIIIPSSVTSIGEWFTFAGCSGLNSIIVEEGNTVYDSRDNCNAIIKTADNKLLYGCNNTFIPNNVTSIDNYAFCECNGLTTITIPNGVTSIGRNAFYGCSRMTSITIPNSVTSIECGTFQNCSDLTSVTIPNNVTSLAELSFYGCSSLTSVIIGKSVTSIGYNAFTGCISLKDFYCYAEKVPETESTAFDKTNIKDVTLHVPAASVSAYQAVEPWKNFKEIVALPSEDDYRPFVEEGKVWKVGSTTGISDGIVKMVEYYYFDGDTIIDGKTCKQMMCQRYVSPNHPDYDLISRDPLLGYSGAWYEEGKKVYYYDTTNKQFRMMYDFSLEANETLLIDEYDLYVVGPKQTGGLEGFKGVHRDIMWYDEENPYYCTTWLEGVGGIDGPYRNVYYGQENHPLFLMSCSVDDEIIYLNDEYEDGATPKGARKKRFDFTHTIKIQPKARIEREKSDVYINSSEREVARPKVKARIRRGEEQSPYGEYNDQQLGINLDPLDDAYLVSITDESGKTVYEKAVNAGSIVALNIDISTYTKGLYTVTVENSRESFTGEFEFETQTTGIKEIRNNNVRMRTEIYNLQGQRLSSLQRGLNFVNGQKVYVK